MLSGSSGWVQCTLTSPIIDVSDCDRLVICLTPTLDYELFEGKRFFFTDFVYPEFVESSLVFPVL